MTRTRSDRTRRRRVGFGLAVALMVTAGCSVGPTYVRPTAPVPAGYKELDGWKIAEPRDEMPRGAWWALYGDPELARLEERIAVSNQDLAAAAARFRQARALVASARASWWPTIAIGVSATRTRQAGTGGSTGSSGPQNEFAMPLSAMWEADVWGRIRRTVEANEASAQASAADLAAIALSLQAELATDYFQLHALDAERQLLDETVAAYERSVELTRSRHAQGVASGADVAQADAQLASTRAQALDVALARAQTEHAIAVLVGVPPGSFSLPAVPLAVSPPIVPPGVPSVLLERRPDVAAAERRVAAANAQIGVAVAAYYPTITLSASGGFTSSDAATWLTWPSRVWSFGPSLQETVFDGGKRSALTAQARAIYDEEVAAYRRQVLAAFQNVEDQLVALRLLGEEHRQQEAAVDAAREALRVVRNQYQAGISSYLDVVVTQTIALANERVAVQTLGRRMAASVALVQALGGGWTASATPDAAGDAGSRAGVVPLARAAW